MSYSIGKQYHKICQHLYMGSAPMTAHDVQNFDLVVLCAAEHQPVLPGIRVIHCPLPDSSLKVHEAMIALDAAQKVAHAVQKGHDVLVTCFMGLNRSGLITALALLMLFDISAEEAVNQIRKQRSVHALQNEYFIGMIVKQAEQLASRRKIQ